MSKFSKAHYQIVADAIRESNEETPVGKRSPLIFLREKLIFQFSQDNPKFDPGRFMRACEPKERM
jgi:hypothetical protein